MNISALLSPQESPGRDASSVVTKAPARKPRKSKSTTNPVGASPLSRAYIPPEVAPHNGVVTARLPMPSPPTAGSPLQLGMKTVLTPPTDGPVPHRQSATSGMDTLADLASMQHHQQTARANAGGLRSTDVYDSQLAPASSLPTYHTLTRKSSTPRGSLDLIMQDAPSQTAPPRVFTADSLSETELQTVTQLVSYLAENPYAYDSHVQLVRLLHRGLIEHVHPSNGSRESGEPHTYALLQDLQKATEAMDARFALGEDLWADRLQAQKMRAGTLDECLAVMETCQKAVDEETGSTKLWLLYAGWMLVLYNTSHKADQYSFHADDFFRTTGRWTEEDIIVAAEVFAKKQVLDIWSRAAQETKFRLNDSHVIWNQYTDLLLQDLGQQAPKEAIAFLKQHFIDRLQIPHANWDQTFQAFSNFISAHDNTAYEQIMVTTNSLGTHARQAYESRAHFETRLQNAINEADKATEWTVMTEYLDFERTQGGKKKVMIFDLSNALYQRAILRFGSDTSLWEDYVMFLVDELDHKRHTLASLPVLERACRHCPWSGTLWSQYLQEAERQNRPFTDIGEIKHKATSTGLLDAGGMEEVLKVLTAWCGFLRRQAFEPDSTDEELDVAEVGIRSAIEDMETLGRQKYDTDYQGDPQYRLERIYIKYLSQSRNWQAARDTWKSLIGRHGDSYEFWLRYYNWEMLTWGKHSPVDRLVPDQIPHEATKVLRQAAKRQKLDWPEKIMDTFLAHCEDHESVVELQNAVNQTRKAMKIITRRREKEALEAAELAQQQHQLVIDTNAEDDGALVGGKRKRADDNMSVGASVKKSRPEVIETTEHGTEEPSTSVLPVLKRDRENSTVYVKNLPPNATETRVRQYFRDCGIINSLKLSLNEGGGSQTAFIEFDSKEDVLTARTKDMKSFDGKEIEVQVGTGTTLYVTNFPPTADESHIRKLFGKYGDIVSIRFPSLKYNKRRRFCYIQYQSSSQAQAATVLDGMAQEGDVKLDVKVSDPDHKKSRTGAVYDGRELHISNLDWSATEDDLSLVFSKYGSIERVRIPRDMGGKSKGFAFVVFSNTDDATAALDLNLTKFKSRLLHVSMSTADPAKRQAQATATRQSSTSTSPAPQQQDGISSSPGDSSSLKNTNVTPRPSPADISARTIALLNIPDTVNEARVRAILTPFGTIKKLTMRLDHQGAIVEFATVTSVGKASLSLEGTEIAEGRPLRVGSVEELLGTRAEVRSDRIITGSKGGAAGGSGHLLQTNGIVKRPGLGTRSGRRGGKGGLGLKGSGGGLGGPRAAAATTTVTVTEVANEVKPVDAAAQLADGDGNRDEVHGDTKMAGADDSAADGAVGGKPAAKSNADFKAMFLKS